MGAISPERIEEVFRKTGFRRETVAKVLHLLEFLREFSASSLPRQFALIGGTAIHLGSRDIPRLSEDIDLDYIEDPSLGIRDDLLDSVKRRHISEIGKLAAKLGWDAKLDQRKSARRDSTLFLRAPGEFRIELNLSYRQCHNLFPPVEFQIGPLEGDRLQSQAKLQTLRKEELWASKLVACIQDKPPKEIGWTRNPNPRVKARHIYDVYWLSCHLPGEVDSDSLRKCFLLFGVSRIKHFAWHRGEIIRHFKPNDVHRYVLPMLRQTERTLVPKDVAWHVRQFLDRSVYARISPEEYGFLEAWEHGTFLPLMLFPEKPYAGLAQSLEKTRYYDEVLGKLVGGAVKK